MFICYSFYLGWLQIVHIINFRTEVAVLELLDAQDYESDQQLCESFDTHAIN